MFKWLNKQGVESDSGFVVQFTGRFTCEYRENGQKIEIEVESGFSGGRPSVSIKRDAFAQWGRLRPFHEAPAEEQARLLKNFKEAMEFQGLAVDVY
ncbi:hypothetical protein [Propionivibrio sp.]|uniref:hypothetical protein n=1 Tax=Propionivibrio sp. TaxID=2212460 RepID=UPI0039E410AB